MRHILVATAFAAGALIATTAANAQTYDAGGADRVGNMCRVNSDFANPEMDGYGYYAPCGYRAVAEVPAPIAPRVQAFQGAYDAGGVERLGNTCRVNADFANPEMDDYGYYAPCR